MPVVPEQTFQVAGGLQPLTTPSSNSLLFDADKTIFFGLDFWAWVIEFFVGARLVAASATAGAQAITSAVAQKYPNAPDDWLQSDQVKFPLLAMYRKESRYEWRRVGWTDHHASFDLIYVLPPMNAGMGHQVLPILNAVEKAIIAKTVQSYDPSYTPPGGTAGQTPWGLQFAAVEEIGFERGHRGNWPAPKGNQSYPFLLMEGFAKERDIYVPPSTKFDGGDIQVDLLASDGTAISPFVRVSTQGAPTITSLSQASGTIAGGTSVTITGSRFLSGPPRVLFGGNYSPSVTFTNSTTIVATTPAASGGGVVDVRVENRDGQSATATRAFTYMVP